MVAFLVRRVAHGVGALVAVAFLAYGLERALRPENYPGQPYFSSLWHDVTRALLHLDFGGACSRPGCPSIHELWVNGLTGDITMVAGGMAIAILGGVRLGVWCARHPRSFVARAAEGLGMVAFCAPVYVVGMGLLLLFNHDFGIVRVPFLFDALPGNYATPWSDPWDWLRAYLVPCLVVAAPLAGACVRVTAAMTREELGADHVRTAIAKGLKTGTIIRRHAAPGAYPGVTAFTWGFIPTFVTNLVLVESVFSVPGFFFYTRRAIGQDTGFSGIDVPMLQAVALWAGAVIIVLGILADVALAAIDPRVRAAGRLPG